MSWTLEMLDESAHLLARINDHPFLQQVADGTVPDENLAFYFEQNVHYLDAAIRCRSIGAAKSQSADQRSFFLGSMDWVAAELADQERFLKAMGARFPAPIAPTCHAYTRHIVTLAWERDPVEYVAGYLACPMSYDNIGLHLVGRRLRPDVAEWWQFARSEDHHDLCDNYVAFVDKYSVGLSDERLERMLATLQIGLNYEYMFWDMAYKLEEWPLGSRGSHVGG